MSLDNKSPIWNLPNILTLLRIAAIPLLVALLLSPSRAAGFWAAKVKANRLDSELSRRYVQSIDPYRAAGMRP